MFLTARQIPQARERGPYIWIPYKENKGIWIPYKENQDTDMQTT